jgi:glycosyltransferase involved in cell wall biosynthesis
MRVLRVYHAGRNPTQRARERALAAAGIDVALIVPSHWEGEGIDSVRDQFPIIQVPVSRAGDVNRHAYRGLSALRRLVRDLHPDILDLNEEPFSVASRQWLRAVHPATPVLMYTAQNIDKRFPPPFAQYERAAYRRVAALYPCTKQAASVARGKGFAGPIEVLPLGYDPRVFRAGGQSLADQEIVLALVGRLVPEKGAKDAVKVLARVNAARPARLLLVGSGPEVQPARELAATLGLADRVDLEPWAPSAELANVYRQAHVTLIPSTATRTWTEQFGRVIVEAQACGSVVAGYASGSIPEVAGDAAVLVEPGSTVRLADEVVQLLRDHDGYADFRGRGIAACRTRTWTSVAERHADLYRRVAIGVQRRKMPRSPSERRAVGRMEFGTTASSAGGPRPFALPILRRGGVLSTLLATLTDAGAELIQRLGRGSG